MRNLNIEDTMDFDWLITMHNISHDMVIDRRTNFEDKHVVNYGNGASKLVTHSAYLKYLKYIFE